MKIEVIEIRPTQPVQEIEQVSTTKNQASSINIKEFEKIQPKNEK